MILVTTKMSGRVFKNYYHCYKTSAINTQVKDHILLETKQKEFLEHWIYQEWKKC